jgi:hypothetical protein
LKFDVIVGQACFEKIIAYLKDEGSNLNATINALNMLLIVNVLGLETSFQGNYFGHIFSKACQYDSTDENIYKKLKYVYVKSTQIDL